MAGKTIAEARIKQRDDAKAAKAGKATPAGAASLTALATSPVSSIIDARILPSMSAAEISE